MEHVYKALKNFSINSNEIENNLMLKFISENLKDNHHEQIFYIIEKFCQENEIEINSILNLHDEDLNFLYYDFNENIIPVKLLKMIYKFLVLNIESGKIENFREF